MDTMQFGVDFIWVTKELRAKTDKATEDIFDDALVRFLLFDWGLNAFEVDECAKIFWQRVEQKSLGDFVSAMVRLTEAVQTNAQSKVHWMRDIAAIVHVQLAEYSDEQRAMVDTFPIALDLKPSELRVAFERGLDLGATLRFLGGAYAQSKRATD